MRSSRFARRALKIIIDGSLQSSRGLQSIPNEVELLMKCLRSMKQSQKDLLLFHPQKIMMGEVQAKKNKKCPKPPPCAPMPPPPCPPRRTSPCPDPLDRPPQPKICPDPTYPCPQKCPTPCQKK